MMMMMAYGGDNIGHIGDDDDDDDDDGIDATSTADMSEEVVVPICWGCNDFYVCLSLKRLLCFFQHGVRPDFGN